MASCGAAQANGPGASPVTVVPLDGKHRGIVLRAQTIDATIREADGVVWADTQIWMLLQNPGAVPITVPVTLPGPRAFPGDLPENLEIRLNGAPVVAAPLADQGDQGPNLRADLFVPAGKSVQLDVSYQQALPQSGDMAVFAYLATAAKQWARAPEAVRVTLKLAPPITAAQILSIAPPPRRAHNGEMTWHWEGEKHMLNVGLALVPPARWNALEAERNKANTPGAGVGAQIALSQQYKGLTRLPALPFENADFYERFYPAVAGALQTAADETAVAAAPEDVAVHTLLAALYRERGEKLGGTAGNYYTQLAAEEIIRGLAAGARDDETIGLARDLLSGALAQARERGDAAAAAQYQAQLAAINTEPATRSAEQERRADDLAHAALAAERGELDRARVLAEAVLGREGVLLPEAPPPAVSSVLLDITVTPALQRIAVGFADGPIPGSGDQLLAEVAGALGSGERVKSYPESGRLILEITTRDADELAQIQADLAKRLPPRPELALLADVLKPGQGGFTEGKTPLRSTTTFAEHANLEPSRALWSELAQRLETAAEELAGSAGDSLETKTVDGEQDAERVRSALWRADAAAWRQLAASSRVTYRVDLGEGDAAREWALQPGDAKQLTAQVTRWDEEEIRKAGAAAAAGILLLAAAITTFLLIVGHLIRRVRA